MPAFGELEATVPYPGPGNPSTVAFHPNGKVIVTLASNVRLWGYDFAAGRQLWSPTVEVGSVAWRPSFHPDGTVLATACISSGLTDSRVRVVDALDGHDQVVLKPVGAGGWRLTAPLFSPDGTLLACHTFQPGQLAVYPTVSLGDADPAPRLIDQTLSGEGGTQDGKPIVAFSADSSILAYYSETLQGEAEIVTNRFVKAIDLVNDRETPVRAPTIGVRNWALSPDGRRIVTVEWNPARTVFYDVETGMSLPGFPLRGAPAKGAVVFSPDKRFVAMATSAGLWMYGIDDGEPVPLLNAFHVEAEAESSSIALSPGGRYVATVSAFTGGRRSLRITDTKTNSLVLQRDDGPAATFSPDGRYVAISGVGQTIEIRHVGDPPAPLGGALFPGTVRCRAELRDDVLAVGLAGGDPRTVVVATAEDRDTVTMLGADDAHPLRTFTVPGSIVAVAGGDDAAFSVVGGTDGVLRVRRIDDGLDWSSRARGPINAVAVANGVVASASSDGFARVYSVDPAPGDDLANRAPGRQIGDAADPRGMLHVALSADGRYVAAGCSDGRVYVSDWRTGVSTSFWQNGNRVNCVEFGGGHVVAAGFDWTSAIVFDAETGDSVEYDVVGRVSAVALSADSTLLATVVADQLNRLDVWSLTAGPGHDPVLRTYWEAGSINTIADVAFSPVSSILAVALEVGRVEIRDTNALDRVLTVLPFEGPVNSIRFSVDGALLVAASDRVLRVYDAI